MVCRVAGCLKWRGADGEILTRKGAGFIVKSMSMFVDRLMEALASPSLHPSQSGDDLLVDGAKYRALFMTELRERQRVQGLLVSESRRPTEGHAAPRAAEEAAAAWVKDGWLDDSLHGIADSLIEMGVVRDQVLLDHFLHAAVLERLGAQNFLSPTDSMLLHLSARPVSLGCEELDVRLLARRYACQIGLLLSQVPGGPAALSELGETARRLPPELVLPFVVTLEGLSSYGSADPWRAPQKAYHLLYDRAEVSLHRDEARRMEADPEGMWRFTRLRRWARMGLCEALPAARLPEDCEYAVRLSATGHRALHEALRSPASEVALLCEQLYARSRQQTLAALRPRQAVLRDAGMVLPLYPVDLPPPRATATFSRAFDSAQRSEAPFSGSAQRSEAPFSGSAQRSEAPFSGSAQRGEAPFSGSAQRSEAPGHFTTLDDFFGPIHLEPEVPPATRSEIHSDGRPTLRHGAAVPLVEVPPLIDVSMNPDPPPEQEGLPAVEMRAANPAQEQESFDVEALCKSALRDMQASPRFAHVSLSLAVQPGTPKKRLCLVQGRRPLRILLAELLTAAAAAVSSQTLPRVLLELSASESELSLWLHDNGPGIPISQRPLVFVDRLPHGEPPPRYLLGAVRRVVEEHFRGRIEIAAPRLGGASFRLSFPRHAAQKAA